VSTSLATRLRRHVEHLADDIGERHVLAPESLHAAERYIVETWRGLGFEVNRQSYEAQGVDSANLEITIAGTDRSAEIVLAGAHYDTVPGSPGPTTMPAAWRGSSSWPACYARHGRRARSGSSLSSTRNRLFSSGARWEAVSMRVRRARAVTTSA